MDVSPPAVENRLQGFRDRCGELGLAMTPQRLAIYRILASDPDHPAAEEIYRRLKPDMPSLSLGTVYRTLELFEQHGLVSRVHADGEQARFDANRESHHHLVCTRCRRITDIEDPALGSVSVDASKLDGFQVTGYQIHFLGLCPDCREA